MNQEFLNALNEIVETKGIDKEILIDTIEQALSTVSISKTSVRHRMLK